MPPIGHLNGVFEQDEEKLKNTNKDLTMVKMKSMFAIGKYQEVKRLI